MKTMSRDEVKETLLRISKEKYNLDLDNFAEDAPLAELQQLNEKIDSLAVIEMIFDVEDELKIKVNSADMSQPANLAEIIDSLHVAVNDPDNHVANQKAAERAAKQNKDESVSS